MSKAVKFGYKCGKYIYFDLENTFILPGMLKCEVFVHKLLSWTNHTWE